MGKKSVLVIFFGILLALGIVQYRLDVRSANLKGFEIQLVERERSIRLVSAIAESLIATGRRDLIEGHLRDAIRVGWIDFYLMTFNGEVVAFDSVRPLSDDAYATLMQTHPADAFWEFHSKFEPVASIRGPASAGVEGIEDFRFFESDLQDKRRLKLGLNTNREAFLAEMDAYRSGENNRIFVLSMLMTVAVFLFSARDLLRVAKIVRTKGVRGLKELRVLSKEAAVLQQGIEGFSDAVDRLERENQTLEAQVLPSLRSELHSGKKPPYDFNCTMVRTDINNFTSIFHTYPSEPFLATINEFFIECSHIISRYDGFIHEFVGDEIIYYFKDEQHANSFTAALACTRQIELAAERIHARMTEERGYAFKIKSGLSYGKIRFGALLNGFSLAGAPLIETARIVGAVHEREENTVHFDSSNVIRLNGVVSFAESFRASLKGMEGERTLMRYLGHKPLSEIIKHAESSNTHGSRVVYDYRSDDELSQLLKMLEASSATSLAGDALHMLHQIRVTACGNHYLTTLLSVIRTLADRQQKIDASAKTASFTDARALATLAGALARLVPREYLDVKVHNLLVELIEHRDSRVVANTIETLQAIRLVGRSSQILDRRLVDSKNTRVAANSLIYLGTEDISSDVLKRLRKLLDSNDSNHVAAGLFAWGEIAKHHIETDLVYYRTQSEFLALQNRFESICAAHPTAARHATEAIKKSKLAVSADKFLKIS